MALEQVTFHVTDRCQLDCEHCLRDPGQKPLDLEPELVARTLAEAKRKYRSDHTGFTGGEPTLHPRFAELVDAAIDQGFTWHMVTNGRKLAETLSMLAQRPARLAGLTAVNLSLDGATEATHDGIRGKGSYREVMAATSVCTALGLKVVFNVTIHAKNQGEIEAVGLLASQLGAARLSFVQMQPTGTHLDRELALTARQWRAVMDRIDRLAAALTLPVSVPEGFFREQPFHVCAAFSQQQLHVDVHGRVVLCCQHAGIPSEGREDEIAGDLHAMSLVDAHASLIEIIHRAQAEKVQAVKRGDLDEWGHFPCNHCLKSFGKPHWSDAGAVGPAATRERWTGAWAKPDAKRLPIVR